jgi:hypothetical protein
MRWPALRGKFEAACERLAACSLTAIDALTEGSFP